MEDIKFENQPPSNYLLDLCGNNKMVISSTSVIVSVPDIVNSDILLFIRQPDQHNFVVARVDGSPSDALNICQQLAELIDQHAGFDKDPSAARLSIGYHVSSIWKKDGYDVAAHRVKEALLSLGYPVNSTLEELVIGNDDNKLLVRNRVEVVVNGIDRRDGGVSTSRVTTSRAPTPR